MASPPPYSPSPPNGLALPRQQQQRPTLALPTNISSRKPSITSATSSAHPLRQTSFPPSDSLEAQHELAQRQRQQQYSPSIDGEFSDDDVGDEIKSTLSGPASTLNGGTGTKRKRMLDGQGKKGKGRPGTKASNGADDETRSVKRRAGAASVRTADDADAELDSDSEPDAGPTGRAPLYAGGEQSEEAKLEEKNRKTAFYELVPEEHRYRYDQWNRAKLRTGDVRKLVNSTLSQSVPANVVLAVSAYAKMFAGMLVEEARGIQGEWEASEERRADGKEGRAIKRLKKTRELEMEKEKENQDGEQEVDGTAKTTGADDDVPPLFPGGAGGLSKDIEECDRGPLLPDHLREALRRYKKRKAGGPVGFTGLSLEGRENTATRMGGRRLFK
ncbi:hypothetical protein LTR56_007670 [Elasticomyces elasticus]|nr:hypothetical protein LTR56_007670 [Elasticomyces elasticus]KAK3665370.1 hypothetical protein LTR22_003893 [Elasticomyces elasticus]KAK4929656.1 hypothetical protein LTR49_003613 [Elasticomyces elasticus]KAK5761123.1 hypothetical protein LTS12_008801 [Elasticomyces elasticus]